MSSKRLYSILGFDHAIESKGEVITDNHIVNRIFKLTDLLKHEDDPTELMITLNEDIDKILDMGVGETIFTRLSRDHMDSKGVILRLK